MSKQFSDMFSDLLGDADSSPQKGPSVSGTVLPSTCSESALAVLFGVSAAYIRTLARDGIVVRVGKGRFDPEISLRNYLARLREVAGRIGQTPAGGDDLKAEKLRLTRAQAEKAELHNRQAAGEMVAIADVRQEWVTVAADLRSQILAIPARVSARAALSREASVMLDEELRLALEGLHDER